MKHGTIIKLGRHRLACGDSTDHQLVARLIGDDTVRMILTDPPYGVAYVESKAGMAKLGKEKPIANDQFQTNEEYERFTVAWLDAVKGKLASHNTFYIFNSDLMYCALRHAIEKAGYFYSQMIVWVKSAPVMGRKDYLPQSELIAYGWMGRHKRERSKGKGVIFHAKPSASRLHPTMKPPGLLRKLLLDSTKIGETVYDPFGGSGSTLVACEHTQRRCLMVEMDPEYAKTIVRRWETLTGNKAEVLE